MEIEEKEVIESRQAGAEAGREASFTHLGLLFLE